MNMDRYIEMKINLTRKEIEYLRSQVKDGIMDDNPQETKFILNRLKELNNEIMNILKSDRYNT